MTKKHHAVGKMSGLSSVSPYWRLAGLVLAWLFCGGVPKVNASLTYCPPPRNGLEIVRTNVSEFLNDLGGFRLDQLTISEPFQRYCSFDTNFGPRYLSEAKPYHWVYPILHGTNVVGTGELMPSTKTPGEVEFACLGASGPFFGEMLAAIEEAKRLPETAKSDYEVRCYDRVDIWFTSLWLHGRTNDIVIPLPPTYGRYTAYKCYGEGELAGILKPLVIEEREKDRLFHLTETPPGNPFIGTAPNPQVKMGFKANAGNVFPGAVCPRGMLAWSPDTTSYRQAPGGYMYDDPSITGFSLTHFSGRGMMYLMDVPFMPVIQPVNNSPGTNWDNYAAAFSHTNEIAFPGYYRVTFDNGITTELTATPRTGMARFAFPTNSAATLLIQADSSIAVSGNEIAGFHQSEISGGKKPYTVYFAAQFDRPFQSVKTWKADSISADTSATGPACGAILSFDPASNPVVQVRTAISYISIENARANLAAENTGRDFDQLRQAADVLWNADLGRIEVHGGTDAERTVFYTALYHCFMHPNILDDANGQYPGMDGLIHTVPTGHHQYQNIPAWDQYRSHCQLVAILRPDESSDIAQSLVNYAQQDASVRPDGGGLPRWEQVNHNSGGMVGDGDDAIISSAYAFGAMNFDTKGALAAMDKGASVPDTTSDGAKVRANLDQYLKLGYIPGPVSANLEYYIHDFAIGQFAKNLGDTAKWREYQNRAQNWEKLWDDSTGYLRPREADGSWGANFSPKANRGYTEGTAAQYVWMVNFNLRGLIDKMGGNAKAVERLDKFFTKLNSGGRSETAWLGNEPGENSPWVYDFAGAPSHTQEVVRRAQIQLFTALPSGIPGNDDAGAMSSWYVFSALGLYPEIPGVAGFAVGSPVFPEADVHFGNGSTLVITGNQAAADHPYVAALKLNDTKYDRCWIPWSSVSSGGKLEFELSDQPSDWASGTNQAPPSFGMVGP